MDILWPRWVARIGVTRATEACFLTADRQCTELPLLRLPRLVPEVVGCDPCVPRDLARVGWRGLAAGKGGVRSRSPYSPPHSSPSGRISGHASQIRFSRLGQARGASPGSLDQRSEEWPLCEGKSGALDASVRPSEGGRELRGPLGRLSSALPRGGGGSHLEWTADELRILLVLHRPPEATERVRAQSHLRLHAAKSRRLMD